MSIECLGSLIRLISTPSFLANSMKSGFLEMDSRSRAPQLKSSLVNGNHVALLGTDVVPRRKQVYLLM